MSREKLAERWSHLPSKILPKYWSCDWLEFQRTCWFLPPWEFNQTYDMSLLDIALSAAYGVSYPIKGVMFCRLPWHEPGSTLHNLPLRDPPAENHERVVLLDALGDYYYHYEYVSGGDEFVGKFRAPRGTEAEDFVKNYFKGGVKGVDMDRVLPNYGNHYDDLLAEQRELGKLRKQAEAESRCACKLKGLLLY
jgi:hypothetical protein